MQRYYFFANLFSSLITDISAPFFFDKQCLVEIASSRILHLLIGREESFTIAQYKAGDFSIYVKCQVASPTVLSTEKHDKSRKSEGESQPILARVSFLASSQRCFLQKDDERCATKKEGARGGSPGRARLVKLFPPRTEKLLSNIHGSIWHQTALRACLYGVSENVHEVREEG